MLLLHKYIKAAIMLHIFLLLTKKLQVGAPIRGITARDGLTLTRWLGTHPNIRKASIIASLTIPCEKSLAIG
jgi:hypothetical protein